MKALIEQMEKLETRPLSKIITKAINEELERQGLAIRATGFGCRKTKTTLEFSSWMNKGKK